MDANFFPQTAELLRFLPETILTIAGTLLLVVEGYKKEHDSRSSIVTLTAIAIGLAMYGTVVAYQTPGMAFSNMLISDGYAAFFRLVVLAVGLLTVLSSSAYLEREKSNTGEFYVLILFSLAGQCLMVAANELMMVFIGLEVSSIASYILAGYLRDDKRGNEAALKYFLLGTFATAFLLYGVAWIYGMTGSTNLLEIREAITKGVPSMTMVSAAAGLMLVGFAFKISAAPFQGWAPDVYQGAPAPVSGFLSAGPKAAAFAVMIRVFQTAFEAITPRWEPVLWTMALATMTIGNFAALWQNNIKRMLGYSYIAHAGYVLVAVTTHSSTGTAAAMFYLAAYALMNYGAFAIVTHVAGKGEGRVTLDDMKGLSQREPAVAAYYYLRVLVVTYMHEPETTEHPTAIPSGLKITMWVTAAATLVLGVFPGLVLDFATRFAVLNK